MSMPAGSRLGSYEIVGAIGAGGMGEVYRARDTKLNRTVAIKLILTGSAASGQAQRRLLGEARAAAALDHPNICAIHEVSEADGRVFIVMQYVDGETLQARLQRAPLPIGDALSIAAHVVDALAEAHAHGTIHRDIKPSNIMLTPRGGVKVLDFGLATRSADAPASVTEVATQSALTAVGAVMGTVPYMSPEQVRGEPLDARSDLFSFGVMLYEMVSGQPPFTAANSASLMAAILTEDPQPLARYARDTPPELERIVSKAMRKDRDSRYQTAKDLLIDVRTLQDDVRTGAARARSASLSTSAATISGSHAQAAVSTASAHAETVAAARPTHLSLRTPLIAIALLAVAGAGVWFYRHRTNVAWATAQVPRIEALAQSRDFFQAYDLAQAARKYLPSDPTITRLMPTLADTLSVTTTPASAQVYLKRFAPDASGAVPPRELIGATPIKNLQIARGEYVVSIEKTGYVPAEFTVSGAVIRAGASTVLPPPIVVNQNLSAQGATPDGMVFVPGGDYRLVNWSRPTETRVKLNDFFIDRYEVSNRDFQEFIAAGGYLKKQYWEHSFVKDGKTLTWEEAMKVLIDRTDLPGPRGWSGQTFPEAKADHPVTGITWYEAAAYAAFLGKQLPTIFQWEKAARAGRTSAFANYMPWGIFYPGDTLAHHANFDNSGTIPVSSAEFGMSPFGAYNMAGNVSEWTLNDISRSHAASGGAWGQPSYTFAQYGLLPGFYHSEKVGFRSAKRLDATIADASAMRIEIEQEIPTYAPSSQASFNQWLADYRYEKTPLDAKITETKDTADWHRETITFNGANGGRAMAYLYLPKHFARPLQVIHLVPTSEVENGLRSITYQMENHLTPCLKAGRALFGVVLEGYLERLRPEGFVEPSPTTVEYRDQVVRGITDLRRGLDYLETRSELDVGRIGLFAPSGGSRTGLLVTAIETRYRSVMFSGAGLRKGFLSFVAGANPIGFAPHVRGPILMMHGKYDESAALKTEAEPLFKLLPQPKRLLLYEGGHVAPYEFFVTTINRWMDETLGPVQHNSP